MTTAITKDMSTDQIDLLKRTICNGATDDELRLFVATCNRLALDPFARQIYAVKRWDKRARKEVMSIQVSIDGFRVVAERTGDYAGQSPVQWCGTDGKWVDVWLEKEPPAAARVAVHRRGFAEPLVRVARWESYVQKGKDGVTPMWRSMPDLMLGKCAEALALRAAFPHDLSGVYAPEEMAQAHNEEVTVHVVEDEPKALPESTEEPSPKQAKSHGQLRNVESAEELHAWCATNAGAVVRGGESKIGKVVAHGEQIGVSPAQTRAWLGVTEAA